MDTRVRNWLHEKFHRPSNRATGALPPHIRANTQANGVEHGMPKIVERMHCRLYAQSSLYIHVENYGRTRDQQQIDLQYGGGVTYPGG